MKGKSTIGKVKSSRLTYMKDIGIDKREGTVVFGQVDGMGDQVSYGLLACTISSSTWFQ
jgi:hypothetical protein